MQIIRLGAITVVAGTLAACSATPETGQGAKENTGTLVGALAGGLIGSQFGGGAGEHIAAGLAGAAIGGPDREPHRRVDGRRRQAARICGANAGT
jgi:hypothetical protein